MKRYRAFIIDEDNLFWFNEEEIPLYRRYGLVKEMKHYLFPVLPRRRIYPICFEGLLKRVEESAFYPKLRKLIDVVSKVGGRLYIVGGSVRDLILFGDICRDPDLLIECDKDLFLKELVKEGVSLKEVTPFLTFKVLIDDEVFDVALCRRETYERAGALPKVFPASLMEDLYRRDFTINAMALGLCGKEKGMVFDPFFGLEDLEKRKLRIIRPYSFIEDPTRIIRGVRLMVRLSFDFEGETLALLKRAIEGKALYLVGWVRVWRELEELFKEEKAVDGVLMMDRLGILESIGISLGEVERDVLEKIRRESLKVEDKVEFLLYAIFGLRGEDEAKKWGLRFQLSKGLRESLVLAHFWRYIDSLNFYEKYNLMKRVSDKLIRFWSLCAGRDLMSLWLSFKGEKPLLSEEDIREIALSKGVEYGRIKMELLRLQMEEGLKTKEEILKRLGKESV